MKDLKFIQACPDDDYYIWQVQLWLESLKELGHLEKAISLVFTPKNRPFNTKWYKLQKDYPEAEFNFYIDEHTIYKLIALYIPILRPYVLMRYFQEHPEMSEKAIFYCDSDILFTERFIVDHLLEDDICYLSNTNSYINASYFDSKAKDVIPEKLEQYNKRDILDETCKLVGISRDIAQKNNEHSGGAQYLIKGADAHFWEKVLTSCIKIRLHLQGVNKEFFENESKGFQSWCSDMWAVLWNLWAEGKETRVVDEMDFAWSSDPIYKIDEVGIFHNAGIVGETQGNIPVFYKGKYHQGLNPLNDPRLDFLYNNEETKTLCNWYYVSKLMKLKQNK